MNKPRVLCLLQLPPPVHGTTVINAQVVRSRRLAERFELDVVPLRFADSIDDVSRPSARKVARAVSAAAQLGVALLWRRPDAVYFTPAGSGPAFYRDLLFVGLMRAFGVPRVYHLHGKGIASQLRHGWKRALYKWSFAGAWVIHLSPMLANDVEALVDATHLMFVPNGIADHASIAAPNRTRARPRILFLSSLAEAKGPLVLLDALGQLRARGLAFDATFAGAPQNATLAAFEQKVELLGLDDRVTYVGPVYGAAKEALFAEHDIFVFPTCHEAFGLVLLEAMQHSLPVIATREGAIPEIVADGETGFLVPPREPALLADRVERLLADPELRRNMGERGRARYEARFTLAHFERSLTDTLAQIVMPARR